jgi:putative DNA primase/helicase
MKHPHHTPDNTRAALAHIPPNLSRDEWAKVGMAIKSEFPDETGFDLFCEWSQPAENFDPKACRDAWKSFKAGGGVTMGTLLHLAKSYGYEPPKDHRPAPTPTPAMLAERKRAAEQAHEREAQEQRQRHEQAATEAAHQWERASEDGQAPYLERKAVQSHGLRFAEGGAVLVPLRDAAGALWNLQSIGPDGQKRFLPGGRKSGLWHMLGTLPADGQSPADDGGVILVAEGYATAASLHQATGWPVAVAFDAGNLGKVAAALRQLHPAALLVLCGDDDRATAAKTGSNPGRDKATAAAGAVQGLAVFPLDLADDASDFNDMHQAQGVAAVRACVVAAVQAHRQALQAAESTGKGNASTTRKKRHSGPDSGPAGQGGGDEDGGRAVADWDRFTVSDAGVFYAGVDKDGEPTKPEWVCSRLDVLSFTRNQDGGGWGYLLSFADPLGNVKTWAMPARMLSGDGAEYRAYLLSQGLRISTAQRARNLMTQYLQSRKPDTFTTCTDRIGWHGRAFVLPRETIGDDAERIVFQSDEAMENTFNQRGTVEQWRDRVGALCEGNSRLAFAVACAFAGPLLRVAGVESGGFHYRGGSSTGKTTALKVAASVNGGSNYLQRWRTTDNALEAIAAQHCDSLLVLDELAQVDPKTAGECAYMLANEQSKARATRNGAPRPRLSWRLLFLSAGELGLADHMAEGMRRARTGQEVRMADIPADAGAGLGMLENLHSLAGGGPEFSRKIVEAAGRCYGAPGRAWLQWLADHADTLRADVRGRLNAMAGEMVPTAAGGQVHRVGLRFALVGVAGEMATAAGLTGWPVGESERAARQCFTAWMSTRGGAGDGEVTAMLRHVRTFLEQHGAGRFTWWHRASDDHAPNTLSRAGYRRMVSEDGKPIKSDPEHYREYGDKIPATQAEGVSSEYFILAETFKAEVCKGFDPAAVARVLLDHGCLLPDKDRAFDCKPRLPGMGLARCYRITPDIFALDV